TRESGHAELPVHRATVGPRGGELGLTIGLFHHVLAVRVCLVRVSHFHRHGVSLQALFALATPDVSMGSHRSTPGPTTVSSVGTRAALGRYFQEAVAVEFLVRGTPRSHAWSARGHLVRIEGVDEF